MIIEKNGVLYRVKETASNWVLEIALDGVDITYNAPKKDFPTFEALKEFVIENDAI